MVLFKIMTQRLITAKYKKTTKLSTHHKIWKEDAENTDYH